MIITKEIHDLMAMFETTMKSNNKITVLGRMDKEEREEWHNQHFYQDGIINSLFIVFMNGYTLGKSGLL